MSAPEVQTAPLYANYWEDDQTANPKIVRILKQHGDFFIVEKPNNEGTVQVHLHTLGRAHYAY